MVDGPTFPRGMFSEKIHGRASYGAPYFAVGTATYFGDFRLRCHLLCAVGSEVQLPAWGRY